MPVVSASEFTSTQFDYIIVGGGTSGLVVAARLTEDPSVTVGVIEAGERASDVPEIDVPGMSGRLIGSPQWDWCFMSAPQRYANNKIVFQPRGKALGGSSMLNLTVLTRASAAEYDAIEALGNPGWNWEQFLKYMKKSETSVPPSTEIEPRFRPTTPLDPAYNGTSGPIVKSYPSWFNELYQPWLDTLNKYGVPINPDAGNGDNVGAMTMRAAVDSRTATRCYAANSYYEPNSSRPNFVVVTGAHASKVLLEPGSGDLKKAVGVEFIHGGSRYIATAKKEVIIAAGSFQTPQILELSGIGNKDILSKFGIEQLIDLPGVGENLQDHVQSFCVFEIDPKYETLEALREAAEMARIQALYKEKKGLLSTVLATAFSFMPAETIADDATIAAWKQKAEAAAPPSSLPSLAKTLALERQWLDDPKFAQAELLLFPGCFLDPAVSAQPDCRYSSMVTALAHPLSRGTVHINSADPLAPPTIDPAYFSNPVDLDMLVALVKFAIKLSQTEPYNKAIKAWYSPTAEQASSDEALREYVKDTVGSVWHPVATASMLPREDGGVVDPKLVVYGTSNLRVADSSIIPVQLSCHTQSVAYAVGEKAADIIKGL